MSAMFSGQTRGVRSLAEMALIFRIFSLIIIDRPDLGNAGWISVAIGCALSLPVTLIDRLRKKTPDRSGVSLLEQNGWSAAVGGALLAGLLTYDAAASARILTEMAATVALLDFSLISLLLPAMLVVLLSVLMGAGTMGAAAVVWSKIAFWLSVVLLVALAGRLETGWLTPALGSGVGALLHGGEQCAGYASAATLGAFALSGQTFKGRLGLAGSLLRAALISVAAALLFSMIIPVMPQIVQTRMFRIRLLMDNGRTSLSMEIIYALLMYGGLILMIGFDVMSASAFARVATRLPGWACAGLCSAAATAVALLGWAEQATVSRLTVWYYPLALLGCALCAIRPRRKEGA